MTWSWLWCWCRFMSASPGFHFWLLSGSRAQQGYMRSPITELWKFLGFKHCSLHSLSLSFICYCYHRAELFAWVLNSPPYHSNMNSLCASTPTQPCAHQILCAIHLVEVDKKFTWQGWTLLQDTMSWYMKWYCTRINKKVILKREKPSSYCFWFHIWPIRP